MDKANINSITRLRINADGQGVRSVIFMQGCPLNCFWCCNPETRRGMDFRTLTTDELYGCIAPDLPYFLASGGGITFSGGEPLLQSDFICSFIRQYCADFTVDMETSLYSDRGTLEKLLPLIHTWNIDFKVFDEEKHIAYTGVSNRRILDNLRFLSERVPKERIIITYPIIPGYNDSEENLRTMTVFLKECGLRQIALHPYRKFSENKQRQHGMDVTSVPLLTRKQYHRICEHFRNAGFTLILRESLYGKDKCRYLKDLRRNLCEGHGLSVEIADCNVTEECIGTCPRCEYELKQINKELQQKR